MSGLVNILKLYKPSGLVDLPPDIERWIHFFFIVLILHGGNRDDCLTCPLVPFKCSRILQFPHRIPIKQNMPWCPCRFKNKAYTVCFFFERTRAPSTDLLHFSLQHHDNGNIFFTSYTPQNPVLIFKYIFWPLGVFIHLQTSRVDWTWNMHDTPGRLG